jgi:hypothetical protein
MSALGKQENVGRKSIFCSFGDQQTTRSKKFIMILCYIRTLLLICIKVYENITFRRRR